MLTPATVQALLDEHRISPKKSLGQHFLADPNTARRIVAPRRRRPPATACVEIGPGIGSLDPRPARRRCRGARGRARRHARERARRGARGRRPGVPRSRSPTRWTSTGPRLLADRGPWACVSNLPYNVAVPVVMRAARGGPGRRSAARDGATRGRRAPRRRARRRAVRRGVGEGRLLRRGGGRRASSPPTVFVPRPKVDSVLVQMRRRAVAAGRRFRRRRSCSRLVRAGFAQRRKMLRRALAPVLGDRAEAVLTRAGVEPTARAEVLGLEQWAAVARSAAAA